MRFVPVVSADIIFFNLHLCFGSRPDCKWFYADWGKWFVNLNVAKIGLRVELFG